MFLNLVKIELVKMSQENGNHFLPKLKIKRIVEITNLKNSVSELNSTFQNNYYSPFSFKFRKKIVDSYN